MQLIRPTFKSSFRVVTDPGIGVWLLSEEHSRLLQGKSYEVIAPLINGERSSDEIIAATKGRLDPSIAWYALMQLESVGFIRESQPHITTEFSAFWEGLGVDPAKALTKLRGTHVRVCSTGLTSNETHQFSETLGQFGIKVSSFTEADLAAPTPSDLDIVLTNDYLSEDLLSFDKAFRSVQQRWLLLRPMGLEIWIGPLFKPTKTGCLHCLRHKLTQTRSHQVMAAQEDPKVGTALPLPMVSATWGVANQLAALEVAKVLAEVESDITGSVFSFDLHKRSTNIHQLIKRPNCPTCGENTSPKKAPPVELEQSQIATFNTDGGYRTIPPEKTLKKYEHLISPITGIAEDFISLIGAPGKDHSLSHIEGVGEVYFLGSKYTVPLDETTKNKKTGLFSWRGTGKGMTAAQAKASALGELLERYSAESQNTDLRIPGSLREMKADAIHPNKTMNFSDRQYELRDSWNKKHKSPFCYVPSPLDPDVCIDWTPIWSLTHKCYRLLPTESIFFTRSPVGRGDKNRGDEKCYFSGCSNGCASGNTLEEAVLQGFLELIERDAIAMWWYNRLRYPAIDLSSFDDPWLSRLVTQL